MNKNIWVIANWKSNKTIAEAIEWVEKAGPQIPKQENLKVVVCPTFSCLSEIKKIIKVNSFPLMIGSQDLSPFEAGAYTGEEAGQLIKQLVDLSILGHSERRQHFFETDQLIVQKVKQALLNSIIPLVCVQGPDTLVPEDCQLVAYEPIFAIGSGNPDSPENAESVAERLKQKTGSTAEILYGGSVTVENVKSFVHQQQINGVLVGKASLDAMEFARIVQECIA